MNTAEVIEVTGDDLSVPPATKQLTFAELENDILLVRREHGQKVTLRLEKGYRVGVVAVIHDKNNRYPYGCVWKGWPGVFWIGRNNKLIHEEVAL